MANEVPGVDDVKDQTSSNLKPGLVGAGSILAGSAILGSALGPVAGGVVGGAYLGGEEGGELTRTAFYMAGNNMAAQGSGGSSGGSGRGRM